MSCIDFVCGIKCYPNKNPHPLLHMDYFIQLQPHCAYSFIHCRRGNIPLLYSSTPWHIRFQFKLFYSLLFDGNQGEVRKDFPEHTCSISLFRKIHTSTPDNGLVFGNIFHMRTAALQPHLLFHFSVLSDFYFKKIHKLYTSVSIRY